MTSSLFPDLVPVELPLTSPKSGLSAGRRLTLRQRADVDAGRHPLTHGRLTTVEGATCGNCRFRKAGRFGKCWWRADGETGPLTRITNGPATDCRAWWPGCADWEAKAS